jgi:hypothetical protein
MKVCKNFIGTTWKRVCDGLFLSQTQLIERPSWGDYEKAAIQRGGDDHSAFRQRALR